MANFCTKCGNPISECTCAASRTPAKKSNFMTIRDFFGVRESDNHLSTADCFERDKEIAPDLIKLSEGEYPIKQFEVGRVRSRSTFSWGYTRIQVTNKRLIQRTVGRSAIGKDIGYSEYAIDDVIGINYTRGKQFSFSDFALIGFISLLIGALGLALGLLGIVIPILVTILAVGFLIFMLAIQKQSNNFLFAVISAFTWESWMGTLIKNNGDVEEICISMASFFILISIISVIRFALLPSISLVVRTKSFHTAAAAVATRRLFAVTRPETILPGKDCEKAIREIGAIITDVQTIGDAAVEKWRSAPRQAAPRQAAPAPQRAAMPQRPAQPDVPMQRPVQQDVPMQRPVRQAAPAPQRAAAPQRPAQPVAQRPAQPVQRPVQPAAPQQPAAPAKPEKKYDFELDFDFDIDNL